MHMTLPQLGNPSSNFFDVRDSAGKSGFDRLQYERESEQGFSLLLKSMRGGDGGTALAQSASSRADVAQEPSHAAQSLPNNRDNPDAELQSRVGVDQVDGTHAVDALVRTDHPVDAMVVESVVDESTEAELVDDEAVEDEPTDADDVPLRMGEPSEKPTASSDVDDEGDDDQDDDAARRTADQRSERGQRGPGEHRNGTTGLHRAESERVPTAAKQTAVSGRPERGLEQHHNASEQGRSSSVKKADESERPPHLERPASAGQDRRAENREPMMFDQRDQREHRVMPAASRAMQVESQVRLENASGQSGTTDISSRIALAAQNGSNGTSFTGEQNGQNLPGQALGSSERATPDDARFSGRVIRGLTAMINQRGGTMTMRLDPPELGRLRIQMTLARGTVSASFFAQTNQARALLEKNMAALRTALENQGLTVERLNVQSSQSSSQQGHLMNEDNAQRQHDHQRHNAAEGESRGKRDDRGESRSDRQSSGEFADVIEQLEQTKHIRH